MKNYELLINGEWVGKDWKQYEVINPATKQPMASVPYGGEAEATAAVDAAAVAFTTWKKKTAQERCDILYRWYELVKENEQEIAALMTEEQGKPLAEALGEVRYANAYIQWYAEEGKRVYGETIPASAPDKRMLVLRQPIGVVAAITPWNFPAAMITRKIAPALAVGCTAVLKPASQTPLTAIKLVEYAEQAGVPKGVINIVTGSAREIGGAWTSDSRVRKLTFTGSTEVGKQLMKDSADTMKKVSLELGGHAPFIVLKDADLEVAVAGVLASKFRNAGQTCICTNRVYVHKDIEEKFVALVAEKVKAMKVGNGLDKTTDIGPMIDENAVEKVNEHVEDARAKGAVVETGGKRATGDGYYYEPTVMSGVTDDMQCMSEETFGPLLPIATFTDVDDAIARANNTPFGLAAYVFTTNLSEAFYVSEALEYGIIGLNDGGPSAAQAPFGGWKESGTGREGGRQGMEDYLETKYISIKL